MNRRANGTFSHSRPDFDAVYAEIRRLDDLRVADGKLGDELRKADKESVAAALLATREAASLALEASKEAITKAEAAQLRYDTGPPSLDTLQAAVSNSDGRTAGSGEVWTRVLAIAAVLGTAGTLIVLIIHG